MSARTIRALPHQIKILQSDKRFNLMVGGVGSGKSYTIGDLLVKYRSETDKNEVFIGANTHRQLRDSTIKAATDRLQMYGFTENDWDYQENKGFFNFAGMKCYLRSLENIDKAVAGLTVDKMIVDEYAFCGRPNQTPMYIHKKIIQRLRGQNGVNQFVALTSPNGINFLHDIWVTKATDEHLLVQCKTKDNVFLPQGYYQALVAAYGGEDTPLARQELFGEFINVNQGRAYYAFDRNRHVKPVNKTYGTIFIAMDFNVNPMTCCLFQIIDNKMKIFEEVYLPDSDTFQMVDELIKRGYAGCTVIPDSTGRNRRTSGISDHQILINAGFKVEWSHNPFVKDRVNAVNHALTNNIIEIDNKCVHLIADLEKVSWKGSDLDKVSDPSLTHVSDAMGYGVYKYFNIKVPQNLNITGY